MYKKIIAVNPASPNFPLPPVWIGVNSNALIVLTGVPTGFTAQLYLTKVGASVAVYFDASVSSDGVISIFVPGANFPAAGTTGKYEIILTETETSRPYWSGKGLLTVMAASSGTVTAGYGTAMETYIRNPATGLYHLITASINEDGDITTVTDPTGVELA